MILRRHHVSVEFEPDADVRLQDVQLRFEINLRNFVVENDFLGDFDCLVSKQKRVIFFDQIIGPAQTVEGIFKDNCSAQRSAVDFKTFRFEYAKMETAAAFTADMFLQQTLVKVKISQLLIDDYLVAGENILPSEIGYCEDAFFVDRSAEMFGLYFIAFDRYAAAEGSALLNY